MPKNSLLQFIIPDSWDAALCLSRIYQFVLGENDELFFKNGTISIVSKNEDHIFEYLDYYVGKLPLK